jgi:hypothetical protein
LCVRALVCVGCVHLSPLFRVMYWKLQVVMGILIDTDYPYGGMRDELGDKWTHSTAVGVSLLCLFRVPSLNILNVLQSVCVVESCSPYAFFHFLFSLSLSLSLSLFLSSSVVLTFHFVFALFSHTRYFVVLARTLAPLYILSCFLQYTYLHLPTYARTYIHTHTFLLRSLLSLLCSYS